MTIMSSDIVIHRISTVVDKLWTKWGSYPQARQTVGQSRHIVIFIFNIYYKPPNGANRTSTAPIGYRNIVGQNGH